MRLLAVIDGVSGSGRTSPRDSLFLLHCCTIIATLAPAALLSSACHSAVRHPAAEMFSTPVERAAAAAANDPPPVPRSLDSDTEADSDTSALVSESDLECALCFSLLFDPVTTAECGHTFCRLCLHRSLELRSSCPLCRSPLTLDALSAPTTSTLATLIQSRWPQRWAQRKEEVSGEVTRRVRQPRFGLFLASSPLAPSQPVQLHIFEARYRVMISKAMLASRQFVFVPEMDSNSRQMLPPPPQPARPDQPAAAAAAAGEAQAQENAAAPGAAPAVPAAAEADGAAAAAAAFPGPAGLDVPPVPRPLAVLDGDVGTLVHIRRVQMLPDGRSFVEGVGGARVRLARVAREGEGSFGLLTAEVSVIEDEPEQEENEPQPAAALDAATASSTSNAAASSAATAGEDEKRVSDEGIRRRHGGAIDDATSSSSTAAATSALPPKPMPASSSSSSSASPLEDSESLASLLSDCSRLLDDYAAARHVTLDRLGAMHGGSCPSPTPEHASEFVWWLLRVLPNLDELKLQILASRSVRQRLQLTRALLQSSVAMERARGQQHVKLAAILCLLALGMILTQRYGFAG